MSAGAKRLLIRVAGFAAGAAAVSLWAQPWNQPAGPYRVEAFIWIAIGGAVGLMLVEPWRRSMRDQDALDRAEEATLDEATLQKLGRHRQWCLGTFALIAMAWMAYTLGLDHWSHSPGFCAAMMGLALIGGLFFGGLVLGFDRRQALYWRIVKRRRREGRAAGG